MDCVKNCVFRMVGWDVCFSVWKIIYIYLCNRRIYIFIFVVLSIVIKELLINWSLLNENFFNVNLIEFGKWLYKVKDIRFVVLFELNNVVILIFWKCKYKYSKLLRKGVKLLKGCYV